MIFTANNGCTFCGSDAHMTSVCPMRNNSKIDGIPAIGSIVLIADGRDVAIKAHTRVAAKPAAIWQSYDEFGYGLAGQFFVDPDGTEPQAIAAQSAPDEREAFEQFYLREIAGSPESLLKDGNGHYVADTTMDVWAGWQARAAWQRAQSAPVVPDGWRLVPAVATLQMKNAGWQEIERQGVDPEDCEMQTIYCALIAAAPQPAAQPAQADEVRQGFASGVQAAAAMIRKKVDDYDRDCGSTDFETGVRQYPGNGEEWVFDMTELADEIAALSASAEGK